MMDMRGIASVGQLVANAITALKSVWKALEGLVSRRKMLEIENRSLKDELARRDEIVGPIGEHGYFFYKDKPDQPLCPKCFQSQPPNPVYLRRIEVGSGGVIGTALTAIGRTTKLQSNSSHLSEWADQMPGYPHA